MTSETAASCPLIFLGICRRAAQREFAWDFLGLSNIVYSVIYPTRLAGLFLVFALQTQHFHEFGGMEGRLTLTDKGNPENKAWSNFSLTSGEKGADLVTERTSIMRVPPQMAEGRATAEYRVLPAVTGLAEPTGVYLFAFPVPQLFLWRPAIVNVELQMGDFNWSLGVLYCQYQLPQPLNPEESRAIAARPDAHRAVVMYVECKQCGDRIDLCALLEPDSELPSGHIEIGQAPDRWRCTCGTHDVDLRYAKGGLHDLLRRHDVQPGPDPITGFLPLYEADRAAALIVDYETLIRGLPREEAVQKFLETNHIFWAFLSPILILHKPPILTKKKADFGILTRSGDLVLVELEKPSTKLVNKDDSVSAQILKGANQIRDWESVVQKYRIALLDELGLSDMNVHRIRYVLVGGLTKDASAIGLSKLRQGAAPGTEFYCFDELAAFLRSTLASLRSL